MKRHFHSFDALRFFAFFKVFLSHIPVNTFPIFNIFRGRGDIGVTFFFVLSGFLITYIILEEKDKTGKLNLLHFYLRRILRIWPLYYLMVGFAFLTPYLISTFHLTYSDEGYIPNWFMSLAFLENYKIILTHSHPNVSPLGVMWSLCVEEHFYLLWGIVLYFVNIKKVPFVIIISIIISAIANIIFIRNNMDTLDIFTNLGYFSFGAIPAHWIVNKKMSFDALVLNIPNIYKYSFIIITLCCVLVAPVAPYQLSLFIEPILFGILFSGILCLIAPANSNIKISDSNIFSRLGVYTYGLYLYHTIIINLFKQFFKKANLGLEKPYYIIAFIIITLGLTIITCLLSYKFFEKPFLKLKAYFYGGVK